MRLAAAQPQTFPTLTYLHLIVSSDLFAVWDDKKTGVKATWQRKMWQTLQSRYADSEHFGSYERDLDRLFRTHFERRADFDAEMLRLCMAWFDVETPVVRAQPEHPVELCKRLGATTFLAGGEINDSPVFEKGCVRLDWHRFAHPSKDLAALDLLLQHGPRSRDLLFGTGDTPPLGWWLINSPPATRGRARR